MNRKKIFMLFFALVVLSLCLVLFDAADEIRVTVLYDNHSANKDVQADAGFSCLVEGAEKTILFDTGYRFRILRNNIKKLKVDLRRVDMIVISHLHGDHTGGLEWVLSQKRDIPVLLPAMATDEYIAQVHQWGGLPQRVKEPREICRRAYSTGEMPADYNHAFTEQSLVLKTSKGLLLITGCAHPGIVATVRLASQVFSGPPRVVMGGFHLEEKSEGEIRIIIAKMKAAGVERCGPSHCTGDRAIALFQKSFAGRFLKLGVGQVLTFAW